MDQAPNAPIAEASGGREIVEAPIAVTMPTAPLLQRQCFGGSYTEGLGGLGTRGQGQGGGGYGGGGYGSGSGIGRSSTSSKTASAPPPPPAPATATPKKSPAKPAESAPMAAPAGMASGPKDAGASLGDLAAAPAAEAAQPVAAQSAPVVTGGLEKAKGAKAEAKADAPSADANSGLVGKKGISTPPAEPVPAVPMVVEESEYDRRAEDRAEQQRAWDWGATVYLSNDDSMSLASAQRLLWAIQNRGPVSTSQVRPHEFLNYFSFDTAPVAKGDTFSVLGSAAQTGPETLTMAFAVKGATPPRKALDLTMVLDRSGSMSAEGRMDYLKRGLHKMADQLQPGDQVDLVLFDDELCTPLENFVVGRDDMSILRATIDQLQPRGSTNLDIGLKEGYRIAGGRAKEDNRSRRVMLITDALLNTGDVNANTVTEIAKSYEGKDIRLTGVGVGRDFNDSVLNMLTEKGHGAYVYLGSEAVVDRLFGVGFRSMVDVVAHDVHFSVKLPPSLAMEKFYGEEASTVKADVQPINYYAGTSQLFLQDVHMRDGRPVLADRVVFTMEYKDPDTEQTRVQTWSSTVGQILEADPHNLQKGRALMAWTDMILARSMGSQPCGAPYAAWAERVEPLQDDAEITWLDGLTRPLCGDTPRPPKPVERGVAYKVKLDADMPIPEVTLQCGAQRYRSPLSGSDSVARFTADPGACVLTFSGNVPMQAAVEVPATGGEVRCMVRGGRVSCS